MELIAAREDVCKVDRVEGGFLVKHYPNKDTKRPCCQMTVRVTDADRRNATELDPTGEIAALRRADAAFERKHAG